MLHRVPFSIGLIGLALVLPAALARAAWGAESKKIQVPIVTPLSGNVLPIMEASHHSIKMALEEVNAKGVTIKGERYVLEPRWYDEECNPRVGVSALRAALTQVKPIHIVWTPSCSSVAVAMRPILLESGQIVLNSTSGTPRFTGPKGNPFLFKIKENGGWRSRDLVRFMLAQGWKRAVALVVNNDWGKDEMDGFLKAAQQEGLALLRSLSYDQGTQEFTPYLVQLRALAPDAVFMGAHLIDEQMAFLRQYRQLAMRPALVGPPTWTQEVAEKAGWELMDGMVTVSSWIPTENRPAVRQYVEKYRKRVGEVPGFNGPPAYDMVHITAQAFELAGSLEREAVRKVLREHAFSGTVYAGGKAKFDDNGQAEFSLYATRFDAKKRDVEIVWPKP